ncbi:MAG: septal ring lytic transglycosylase RlpA family protein [Balneola sp.]
MRAFNKLFLLICISVFAISCGVTKKGIKSDSISGDRTGSKTPATSDLPTKKGALIETGVASWYGPNFNGRLTANGETFDMNGISAAHRTLPFNSEVIVVNEDNGKSIRVRINDRGPYAKDRIIDLSKGAAQAVDMIGPGTANVTIYLVKGDLKNSRVTDLKVPTYTVQLGSYNDLAPAQIQSKKIKGSRVETLNLNSGTVYRIYFGLYKDRNKAEKEMRSLKRKGFNGFVKQIEND